MYQMEKLYLSQVIEEKPVDDITNYLLLRLSC